MKLLKNNHGVAHMAILLIFAAAAIGFVGYTSWNAWQANKIKYEAKDLPAKKSEKTTTSDIPTGYKEYNNKSKGITLAYPEDWSVDEATPVMGYEDSFAVFASSDYKKGNIPIGGDGVLTGVLLTIQNSTPEGNDVQKDVGSPKFSDDVVKFTLDSNKAMRYFLAYEGTIYSRAVTYRNGTEYDIHLHYPQDEGLTIEGAKEKYEPIFLKILNTVKFDN